MDVEAANERTARLRPSMVTPRYGGRLIVATTRQRPPTIERAAARSEDSREGCAGSSFTPASKTTTDCP
ncbi:MAG TPA: hypothetical protein VGE42_11240, partial [Candidatus Dormibacteraeota bacterium]